MNNKRKTWFSRKKNRSETTIPTDKDNITSLNQSKKKPFCPLNGP